MQLSKNIVWLTLAVASVAAAQQDPPGRVGRLGYMTGSVSFQPGGEDEWVPANPNRPLITGDHLWVDQNSRAELHIGGSAVRLNAGTAFEFLNLDDQTVQIRLTQGSAEVHVRFLDENQVFEIDTPNIAFSLLRPGSYRIDANPDAQTTVVTVRSGQGEGTGGGQSFQLRPREQAQISGDQQINLNIVGAPAPDWFDSWADQRDRRDEQSQSARYCSRDMVGYEDLDSAGSWRSESDYGQVWYPRDIPSGWAPYRNGHWAWIEPWGWTWVDDARWGFAPFHYGRWALISGAWGWMPGPVSVRPVYAPALVAFVGGASFSLSLGGGGGVAWFPLGPHEVYVPSYRSSMGYVNRVNVSNTVVNNVTITNVYNNTNINNVSYVNQRAPGGMTAVSRETFVSARPVNQAVVVVRPESLAQAQVMRTVAVAPTRVAVFGQASVNSAPRPPAAVFNRTVVTRATPPPAPVGFSQRQQLLQQNPGRPLEAQQMQQIRAQSPQQVRPAFRPAPPARAVTTAPANPQGVPPQPGQVAPQAPRGDFRNPNMNMPRPLTPAPAPQGNPPVIAPRPPQVQPERQVPPPQDRMVRPAPAPQVQPERPIVRPAPAPQVQPERQAPPPQDRMVRPAPAPQVQPERPAPPPQDRIVRPAPAPQVQPERQAPPPQERMVRPAPAPQVQPERQAPPPQERIVRPAPAPQDRPIVRPAQPPPPPRPEPAPKDRPKQPEKKDEKKDEKK